MLAELRIRDVWQVHDAIAVEPPAHEQHVCLLCSMVFPTRQAWGAHAGRKHGYRAPHTVAAQGRYCSGCCKLYATEGRLGRHLSNSPLCLAVVVSDPSAPAVHAVGHVQAPPVCVRSLEQHVTGVSRSPHSRTTARISGNGATVSHSSTCADKTVHGERPSKAARKSGSKRVSGVAQQLLQWLCPSGVGVMQAFGPGAAQ